MSEACLFAVPVRFRIALARILYSQHVFVRLDSGGLEGAGAGVLYRARPDQIQRLFNESFLPWWERDCGSEVPSEWTAWLQSCARVSPSLSYAIDTALLDLRGRKEGKPLYDLIGGMQRSAVEITEQIFVQEWPKAEAELAAILARGTKWIKVKIGISPQADLAAVRQVRAFVGPNVGLRVDANHAYSLDESELLYRGLADLGVVALEEPLHLRNWPALRQLRERVGLSVILDESILCLEDLDAAIAEQALDVLNLKLTRVGGVTLAREYVDRCREHGVDVAVGCSEDLGIGMAAIVHTAAALDNLNSVEGVGPLRLGFDVVEPVWQVIDGALPVPEGPGLGVVLRTDWLESVPDSVRRFDLTRNPGRLWFFARASRLLQRAENVRVRVLRRMA